ncbi:protein pellino-like isoform X1 [Limulus polyphemus]|uniref:Protein pellino-like isoform X1 n=1 Tax=Limulus polyphemus TaxID=6850 RepID=A0ABM1B8X9_LIMPO|nr:protein pellino-like isoform X1 [Limulus polyphemus]
MVETCQIIRKRLRTSYDSNWLDVCKINGMVCLKMWSETSPSQSKPHIGSSSVDKSSGSSGPSTPHHSHSEIDTSTNGQACKYGELVILGYNGSLPQGEKGRRRSKFVLGKRPVPNGVKKSKHYVVKQPQSSKAILDSMQHSISYTLSRNQAVIVEYMLDDETDMFQIGRSSEIPIDFVVMDTIPGDKAGDCKVTQSTISRFACRFLVERNETHTARVYAAGFDSSRNIFCVCEKATKWQQNGEIDGLTTNGILILHPRGSFCGGSLPGIWREISVGGGVYALRESRSTPQKGTKIEDEINDLQDGTLIDLCGATLLWRSADGLNKSPTKKHLEEMIDELNAGRPQCPVGLNTLVIPRKSTISFSEKQPYVYLICGHVQGLHDWGLDKNSDSRTCPMCLKVGPIVKLCMGIEPAFYVDSGPPTFAFNPCGHMASEQTVKYWASVPIPHGTNGFQATCPFCATPLFGDPGYVRLIFQDHVD